MQDAILILDHDAALAGLIARTLRSQQIYCEPVPYNVSLAKAQSLAPRGLIIAARHDMDVSLADFDLGLLNAGLPILALGAMVLVDQVAASLPNLAWILRLEVGAKRELTPPPVILAQPRAVGEVIVLNTPPPPSTVSPASQEFAPALISKVDPDAMVKLVP